MYPLPAAVFPVAGEYECLSKLVEGTKQCDEIALNKHASSRRMKFIKLLAKRLAQPLPLLLLSLYHLGAVWSSSVGMHTLHSHWLFPAMYACFRCKAFSSGCVEFGFALASPPNKTLTLRMAFEETMFFFPKNCTFWSWAACVVS